VHDGTDNLVLINKYLYWHVFHVQQIIVYTAYCHKYTDYNELLTDKLNICRNLPYYHPNRWTILFSYIQDLLNEDS